MQPMTEKTALALIDALERNTVALQAMQDLTTAIKSGAQVPPVGAYDGAYVARSIVGGIEGIKAENKRARRTTRRAKT